jgi:hypothetical protein
VNYEGPESRIDSAADIVAIGSGLGSASASLSTPLPAGSGPLSKRFGDDARYSVIRARDPSIKEGLDADILVLGPDAQVDHVRNLRRVIAGYLASAWDYSPADAATIAVYVTVYNAVHRGDLSYFSAHYKAVVTAELSAANAGLSLRYDEWPGKSRIVIPLARGARPGAIGAVDTGAVSDKGTVDSLRSQPGSGLGDRQAMTELKDKEAAQRAADLAAKQAAIASDQAKLDQEKAALAADKAAQAAPAQTNPAAAPVSAAVASSNAAPAASGAAAATAPATPSTQAATSATPAAATTPAATAGTTTPVTPAAATASTATPAPASAAPDQGGPAIASREADIAAKQASLDADKAAAAADAQALAGKQAEVAQDRAGIAADQKTAIAAEVAAKDKGAASGLYLLQLIDAANPLARLVCVDQGSGKLIKASVVNSIRPRSLLDSGDSFIAIAGKEGGTGAVRALRLAKSDLSETAEGAIDLFPDSGLWKSGDTFYAVAKDGSSYRLVAFGPDLKEAARSQAAVNPWTAFALAPDGVVVQSAGGGFLVLSPDKLSIVREFKP